MTRPLLLALLLSTSSVLAGCNDGSSGALTIDALSGALLEERCKWLTACGSFPDVTSCKESSADFLDQTVADVKAGLADFDSDRAQQCLDQFSDLDCTRFGPLEKTDLCDTTITGKVVLGGDCFSSSSCAGKAFCQSADSQTCTPGTCVAQIPAAIEGESCADIKCADGLHCDTDKICQIAPVLGEDCSGEPLECARSICELGASATAPGSCVALPTTGGTCDTSVFGGRLSCLELTDFCDRDSSICTEKILPGGACSLLNFNSCVSYAECVGGTCVASPGLGDSCVIDGPIDCLGDLECVDNTCALGPKPALCSF